MFEQVLKTSFISQVCMMSEKGTAENSLNFCLENADRSGEKILDHPREHSPVCGLFYDFLSDSPT